MSAAMRLPVDSSKEVSRLIETLHETSRRLEELTAGEVDTVSSRDGRTFLLRDAQDYLRHNEAAKQAAVLNALPAHIALLNPQGMIVSANEAWRGFTGADVIQRPGYDIGLNYLEICDSARGDGSSEAHQIAQGIRAVLDGKSRSFSVEYTSHSSTENGWFLLTATPLADDRRNGAVVMHVNITEQKRHAIERNAMEEALFVEKERAHVTLNSIGDAVVCTDIPGNVTFLNVVAESLTGWSLHEALGRPLAEVLRLQDGAIGASTTEPTEVAVKHSRILVRRDGFEIPIEECVAPIYDRHGQPTGAVIVIRDVSAARAMTLKMTHAAQHDFLTGLPNRMLFNDRVGQAIALASRHMKQVAVLFLDLDGFKHVNDSLGHAVGDKLLQSVSQRLVDCVRVSDTVSRQGGDEFIVLLSDLQHSEDAAITAGRLLQAVAATHSLDRHDLHVTTSVGVSIYPDDGLDAETLIKNADTAMYQAKEEGRQSYKFFKPAMNVRAVARQSMEEGLRRALERQEFVLHYQPKIDLRTGAITGAEALIRWNHPTLGTIFPAHFIPVAEACGLIVPIGVWVLREACKQARSWLDEGLPLTTMAVNVSAMEFQHENFVKGLFAILRETSLDPRTLELELTESMLMKRPEVATIILASLRERGIKLALDDFGTGYSSLSYLRKFPLDVLKIDQSFIRQISTAGEDTAIVTAVIAMARTLKLRVVAEGVEKLEELEFLRAHQCDEAQGYYFSHPVPAKQFARLLEAHAEVAGTPSLGSLPVFPPAADR